SIAASGSAPAWLANNWRLMIGAYVKDATAFRAVSLTPDERIAQSPAQIARIEAGLGLDALLSDSFDRGSISNNTDRALGFIYLDLLSDDVGSKIWDRDGWDA